MILLAKTASLITYFIQTQFSNFIFNIFIPIILYIKTYFSIFIFLMIFTDLYVMRLNFVIIR
jgi:hypothetical protein